MFKKSHTLILLIVIITLFITQVSCKNYTKNKSHLQVPDASIKAGKKLATQYCGSCHQLPDPSLLDAKSWENGVLPAMGPRLGMFAYGFRQYPSSRYDANVKNYYPEKLQVSFPDWQHIIDYYAATSPDSLLPAKKPVAITINNNLFKIIQPSGTYQMPATSFVKIEADGTLMISDIIKQDLFIFNNKLQITDSIKTHGTVTDVIKNESNFIICNTGILSPNNGKFGTVESASLHDTTINTLYKNLMRPVHLTQADLNKDGKPDLVVCEFGNLIGELCWLEKNDTGYIKHVLRSVPGAISSYVNDYNHDGLPDIWVLFAQGDEGIFLFTNKGNGSFDTKKVISFPPSYGSSSFELDDFNKDGFADIVYTCGDNADYSPVLKPYHGVYVFLNDGKNNFKQKYFYPVNGCYKAIAKDFDNDGDLDIATIAFFADFTHQPQEAFVYFKNEGEYKFQPYSLPAAKLGRWLVMNAGDFNGDGKPDLMLGNFSLVAPVSKLSVDWKTQPPFLILKNIQ